MIFLLPKISFANESNFLSGVNEQVKSVFNYCSGKSLKEDRVNLLRSGFINIKNGIFNGELPSDYRIFVDKFYKDSGINDFYLKKNADGYILMIIDGENTCNSIPLYSQKAASSYLTNESKKDKVSEHDSVGANGEKIKSSVYKINGNIFVLSEIRNKDVDEKYVMITAVRVYY